MTSSDAHRTILSVSKNKAVEKIEVLGSRCCLQRKIRTATAAVLTNLAFPYFAVPSGVPPVCVHKVRGVPSLNLRVSAFTEPKWDYRFMPLSVFLFHVPSFVITERWLQSSLLGVNPHLVHDKRELAQIHRTDPFQVVHTPEAPVLIFLLWQDADLHHYIHWSHIATALALVVYGGVYLADQFLIIHSYLFPRFPYHHITDFLKNQP